MAKKKKAEQESFFVGVKYPNEVRRNILESQKGTISFLRRYEVLKELRIKKVENIEKLRNDIDEISKLVAKVRRSLPKHDLRQEKQGFEKKDIEEPFPRTSEISKLESELSYIEKKLKELS